MRRPVLKVFALAVLIGATTWLLLWTNSLLNFRAKYLEGPEAEKLVEYRGTSITQKDFIFYNLVEPRVNGFTAFLVKEGSDILWGLLYALWGLIGNYIFYLFAFLGPHQINSGELRGIARFVVRAMLAALCGVICFFLVKWLHFAIEKAIVSFNPPKADGPEITAHSVSDSFVFLPILAGIFLDPFYNHLKSILDSTMTFFQEKLRGKSQ